MKQASHPQNYPQKLWNRTIERVGAGTGVVGLIDPAYLVDIIRPLDLCLQKPACSQPSSSVGERSSIL